MAIHNKRFGQRGENAAADWYVSAGYQVLDRNWRCPEGEIDLIVAKGSTVAFVEVKARSSGRYGTGFDAVDWRKQRRVRSVARQWLATCRSADVEHGSGPFYEELRFDVVDVARDGTVQVRHGCF